MKDFDPKAAFDSAFEYAERFSTTANHRYNFKINSILDSFYENDVKGMKLFEGKSALISKNALKCAIYCATISAITFAWNQLVHGHGKTSYIIMFATAAILSEPFCKIMTDFKNEHPYQSAIQWGLTGIAMCTIHGFFNSNLVRFTNTFLLTHGQGPELLIFTTTALAMGVILMSPTNTLSDFIKKKLPDEDKNKKNNDIPQTPAVKKKLDFPNSPKSTEIKLATRNRRANSLSSSTTFTPSTPYVPVHVPVDEPKQHNEPKPECCQEVPFMCKIEQEFKKQVWDKYNERFANKEQQVG